MTVREPPLPGRRHATNVDAERVAVPRQGKLYVQVPAEAIVFPGGGRDKRGPPTKAGGRGGEGQEMANGGRNELRPSREWRSWGRLRGRAGNGKPQKARTKPRPPKPFSLCASASLREAKNGCPIFARRGGVRRSSRSSPLPRMAFVRAIAETGGEWQAPKGADGAAPSQSFLCVSASLREAK